MQEDKVDKLISNLINSIILIDINKYQNLSNEKNKAYTSFTKGQVFADNLFKAIKISDLEDQIKLLKGYEDQINKLSKIIRILQKKINKSGTENEEYSNFLELLDTIRKNLDPRFYETGKGLIDILKKQKEALENNNKNNFVKYYQAENDVLTKIYNLVNKLNPNNSIEDTNKTRTLSKTLRIVTITLLLSVCSYGNFAFAEQYNSYKNSFETIKKNNVPKEIIILLEKLEKHDFKKGPIPSELGDMGDKIYVKIFDSDVFAQGKDLNKDGSYYNITLYFTPNISRETNKLASFFINKSTNKLTCYDFRRNIKDDPRVLDWGLEIIKQLNDKL